MPGRSARAARRALRLPPRSTSSATITSPGTEVVVEPAAEAEHEHALRRRRGQPASGGLGALGAHAGLAHAARRARPRRSARLEAQRRRDQQARSRRARARRAVAAVRRRARRAPARPPLGPTPSARSASRGRGVPAEDRALERRRPAGGGPRAREHEPRHRGPRTGTQRADARARRGTWRRARAWPGSARPWPRARAEAARAAPAGSARAARPRSSPSPARRPTATPPDTGSRRAPRRPRCGRTGTAPACPRRRRRARSQTDRS